MKKNAYGIDFGTTNSVVAVYDLYDKTKEAITPMLHDDLLPHPSIVWYNGKDVTVGREAKSNFNKYIEQPGHSFISSIKSKLGRNQELVVQGELKPAYEIAADIFKHLKIHTEENVKNNDVLDEAVITVPVRFDGKQRADIRKAAQMAGIHVKTFVHEPFAGIVGYLFAGNDKPTELHDGKNILVFDWGGGTLDTTLVKFENGKLFELGTGGITNKAGDYFDKLIESDVMKKFIDSTMLNPDAIQLHPRIKDRLMQRCEENKIELSENEEVDFIVPNFFEYDRESHHLSTSLTRSEFEISISRTVDEALREINLTLEQANISYDQVGMVLLIGGTSQIPYIVSEIEKIFGSRTFQIPDNKSNTVIAEGAAIISKNNWRPYLVHPICVQLSDNSYYTVFDHGTTLVPGQTKKEVTFFVTDNRSGEGYLVLTEKRNGNQQIVKELLNIPISSVLDKTVVEKVKVTFTVDHDLILNVEAVGNVSNKMALTQIHDICYGLRIE